MPPLRSLLTWAFWSASLVIAQEIVYVTDLSIFTVLAPCAASAVSANVQMQTYQNCPEAVTDLQSCACTKNNNFASISTAISRSVSYSCGSTASEDQASAAHVFEAYCNQASIAPFPTPTNPVEQYITDFPAWQDLAPCAASGLSYVVQSMTYDLCPEEPSLLATCVCNKNQNSLLASQRINTSVKYSCSSRTVDIESAQAVFAGYCGLVEGTTSFPTTSDPPGDMTYYITALPEFSSLAPCARTAVSYGVLSQTYNLCPGGPQALASCACLKSGMSGFLTNIITSDVKYYCDSTAREDISSAIDVFGLYCSAAKGLLTPAGVTESVEQTSATGNSVSSGPKETGVSGSSGSPGGAQASGWLSGDEPSGDSTRRSNTGTIVGAVVGVVAGLIIIGLAAFFIWRRSRQNQNQMASPVAGPETGGGKPELDGSASVPGPVSSNSSTLKDQAATRIDNVSPVSAHSLPDTSELQGHNAYPPPHPVPQISELHDQNVYSSVQELQGQGTHPSPTLSPQSPYTPQEAFGQPVYEAPGQQQQPVYEAHGQARSELQGMTSQSGPVAQYHEMDGGYRGH